MLNHFMMYLSLYILQLSFHNILFSIRALMFVRLTDSQTENWVANFNYFLCGGILGVVSRKEECG